MIFRSIARRLTVMLVAILAVCGAVLAGEFDAEKLERVALEEMRKTNTPGAAMGIVRDGKIVWSKGLGLANVETNEAVRPEMLFRLGSTTKMFTSAAVVMLAEEGKLRLQEPISKAVKGLNPKIGELTLHQCLTHTAGLTDESIMSGRHDDAALGDYARSMDASWLFTQPGKIHSYANPGYWLAGLACEQVDQKPYADAMHERIFQPLGMQRTTLRPTLAMTWPLALGHEVKNGKPAIVRPHADNAATWPAGQIYSNIPELARFLTALLDEGKIDGKRVLSNSLITKLTAPSVPRPGGDSHYGYGLTVSTERGVRMWEHGGSRTGYGSTFRLAPDQKVALIILTNHSGSSLPKTAEAALEMLLPFDSAPKTDKPKQEPLSEKEAESLAGEYSNHRQTIRLAIKDGKLRLMASSGGTPGGEIVHAGEGKIGVVSKDSDDEAGLTTTFVVVRSAGGEVEYLCRSSRAYRKLSVEAAKD